MSCAEIHNHRISKVGEDLQDHQVQPLPESHHVQKNAFSFVLFSADFLLLPLPPWDSHRPTFPFLLLTRKSIETLKKKAMFGDTFINAG